MPLVKNIHVDAVLTNISRQVSNSELMSTSIWPVAPVKKDSDVYYQYGAENLRPEKTDWARRTIAKEVQHEMSTEPYKTERHGLQQLVEDDEKQNQDSPLDVMSDATMIIAEKLMVRREIRLADILKAAGTYPAGHSVTLAGVTQWSDFTSATSDPNLNIATARKQIFSQTAKVPNTLVLPREVYEIVREHPKVLDRIKYTQVGVLTPELLATLFDVEKVIISGGLENTANEADAAALSFIWGKNVYLGYVAPRPSLKTASWGYHLESKKMTTERWRDDERQGETVRTHYKDVPKLVTPGAGYIIRDAVA